jgi:hypothetical protein
LGSGSRNARELNKDQAYKGDCDSHKSSRQPLLARILGRRFTLLSPGIVLLMFDHGSA